MVFGVEDFGDFGTRQQSFLAWSFKYAGRGLAQTDGNEALSSNVLRSIVTRRYHAPGLALVSVPKQKTPAVAGVSETKTRLTSCLSCLPPFPSWLFCASWPSLPSCPSSCHRRACTRQTPSTNW